MHHCQICGRPLDSDNDPLSADCGGDCWGGVGKIEADGGCEPSVACIKYDIKEGWRNENGSAKPHAFFLTNNKWQQKVVTGYKPAFEHPLAHCRACGFNHFPDWPWGQNGKLASFDICGCCGAQYGHDDETVESCYTVRKHWVRRNDAFSGRPLKSLPSIGLLPSNCVKYLPHSAPEMMSG